MSKLKKMKTNKVIKILKFSIFCLWMSIPTFAWAGGTSGDDSI